MTEKEQEADETAALRVTKRVHTDNDDRDPLENFTRLDEMHSYDYHVTYPATKEIEVMITEDIPTTRVKLNDSFNGIPLDVIESNQKRKKKITKSHAQYALAAGMMLGIRECVGGIEGLDEHETEILRGQALRDEWQRNVKYKFPTSTACTSATAPTPYAYKFKAYSPRVFSRIRALYGIQKQLFLHSICGNFNLVEFISNAKSGQFFFFSHDGRYMIKTTTQDECNFLLSILPNYYQYLVQHPHSLLTHFYGLYRVRIPDQQVHFCIMKSVFNTPRPMDCIFDLKGSSYGRQAKPGESVWKDLDIVAQNRKLHLPSNVRASLLDQIKCDATFLARLGIMDYSFLLGICESEQHASPLRRRMAKDGAPPGAGAPEKAGARERETERDQEQARQPFAETLNASASTAATEENDEQRQPHWSELDDMAASDDTSISVADLVEWCDFSNLAASPCDFLFLFPNQHAVLDSPLDEEHARTNARDHGPSPFSGRPDGGIVSVNGKQVYYSGIIDMLQHYNMQKTAETWMLMAFGNSIQEISCVDPETYANRFVAFLSTLMVETDNDE